MGVFQTALDILSRPEYGRVQAFKAWEKGKPILPAYWKGLTGKRKETVLDLMKARGILAKDPIKRGIAAFTVAAFAAPEEWILGAGIAKLAKLGIKAASPFAKTVASTSFGRYFSLTGHPLGKLMLQHKHLVSGEHEELLSRLKTFTKDLKQEDLDEVTKVIYAPERYYAKASPIVRDKAAEAVEMFDDLLKRDVKEGIITAQQYEELGNALVREEGWHGISRWSTYVPGVYKKTKVGAPFPRFFSRGRPPYTKPKRFANPGEALEYVDNLRELTTANNVPQAMRMLQKFPEQLRIDFANHVDSLGSIHQLAKGLISEYTPELNIAKLLGIRTMQQSHALARDRILRDVLRNPEWAKKALPGTEKAPPGWKLYFPRWAVQDKIPPEKWAAVSGEGLINLDLIKFLGIDMKRLEGAERWLVKDDVGRELNKLTSRLFNDKEMSTLMRYYDNIVLGPWKTMATVMRMPFHLRNFYSNLVLSWYAGVSPFKMPYYAGIAGKMQLLKHWPDKIKDDVFTTKSGVKLKYSELNDIANKAGIVGRGAFFGEQMAFDVLNEIDVIMKYGKMRHFWLPRFGRNVGLTLENNARLMTFLNELDNTLPKGWALTGEVIHDKHIMNARDVVAKHLYDYTELSPFERRWMRRAIPFYTWIRKNIPQQIENTLIHPWKRTQELRALGYGTEMVTADEWEKGARPKYFDKYLYTRTPFKSAEGNPIYAHIDLPVMNLAELEGIKDFARLFLQAASPLITGLQAVITKTKNFPALGIPIESFPGQREPAPFYAQWLMQVPGMNSLLNIGPHVDYSGRQVLGIGKFAHHLIRTMFPFLNEVGELYPQTPTLEEKSNWRKISYVTGIRFTPLNIHQQRIWREIERRKLESEVIRRARSYGEMPSTRELEDIVIRGKGK